MAGPTLPRRAGRPSRSLDTLHHPTPIRAPPSRGGLLVLPSPVRLAPHPRSRSRPPPPVCGLLAHAIAPHCTLWSVLLLRPGRPVNHHWHTAHLRPLRVKSTSHRFDFLSPRKLHHHRGRGHGWERDGCTRHGLCTDAGVLWLLSIPSPPAYIYGYLSMGLAKCPAPYAPPPPQNARAIRRPPVPLSTRPREHKSHSPLMGDANGQFSSRLWTTRAMVGACRNAIASATSAASFAISSRQAAAPAFSPASFPSQAPA